MKLYKVKFDNKEIEASEYQNKIFDKIECGSGNLIINACAGAAKTTTIVNCIDLINDTERVLFIAFNTDIVNAIKNKIGKRENTNVTTFHSLGYSILCEIYPNLRGTEVNEYKYKNYLKSNIDNLSSCNISKKDKKIYYNNIISLIEYSRYYLYMTQKEISSIAKKYGITCVGDEVKVAKKVLIWGKENINEIDYTDMIWLPNVLNLQTKKHLYDRVFVDEAQDTSIAEQKLVLKCFKRGCRFVIVGDDYQKINIWCGASEEAIDSFRNIPNTEEMLLPITYRCPKKIVEIAKKYSPNIVANENAIDGEIRTGVSKNDPQPGDMVLCRMTAPLIALHLNYLRLNKKSYLKGFENTKESYLDLLNSTNSKVLDINCLTSDGFFPSLYKQLLKKIDIIKNDFKVTDDEAIEHPSIVQLYDNIEGLKTLSEGLTTVNELKEKTNIIFSGNNDNAIQLSTVHKAKGLEADNVYIYLPSLMPSKMAKKEWEIKTEQNLIYVAMTRAKKTLNFIKEDDKWGKNNIYGFSTIKDDVEYYSKKIEYNSEYGIKENEIKPSTKTVINILGHYIPASPEKYPKQKAKGALKMRNLLD